MLPNSNRPASPLTGEAQVIADQSEELPLSDEARQALLRRVETWIEEEERLIAEIERRIAATLGNVTLFPPKAASL
jgi:hypothetical protein